MKKLLSMILALTMALTLAACGGEKAPEADAESGSVDLTAFYNELAEAYKWVDDTADAEDFTEDATIMMDPSQDPEILDGYFPGLSDVAAKQMVIRTSSNSFLVNELVFLECENEEEASKAADLMKNRVAMQVEGGAFYPDSVAVWETAEVLTNGNFVALVAAIEHQTEVVDAFNALFA